MVVSACGTDPQAMETCSRLPGRLTRRACREDCSRAIEIPMYERALDACIARGASGPDATCEFVSPLQQPSIDAESCLIECRRKLHEQGEIRLER